MRVRLKPPVSYYGGKQMLLGEILPLIPYDGISLYGEPFFGGGAVFFAKEPHEVEVINDVNQEVVNFYRVTQTKSEALKNEIECTLHSRSLHRDAYVVYENPHLFDDVKRAWAFWVLCNQGFSSGIGKGWAYAKKSDSCEKKVMNSRERFANIYKERLGMTQIESNDAVKVIQSRDFEKAFFYCDPPYVNSDCGHYAGYSWEDFKRLLDTLSTVKGKFLLSSYPSSMLEDYVKTNGWYQKVITKKVSVSYKTNKTKQEVLTANYPI